MMPEPDIEGSERGKFVERGRRKMLHVVQGIVVLPLTSLWKRVSRALGRSRLGGAQRGDGW